jgi:protein phosphatase
MHSVVLVLGGQRQDIDAQLMRFPEHEVLRSLDIRLDLIGQNERHNVDEIVSQEIHRRMMAKLKLGERVVVDASDFDRAARVPLANAGRSMGIPVIYLITGEVDGSAIRGDGFAETHDARTPYHPILPISDGEMTARFSGVTAIGDVHGMYQSMLTAISWARDRNRFIVLMGDVIDYGPDTLKVADEVYRLVMGGEAIMVLGNHERKIMKWIDGDRVRLSEGNRVTTTALTALSESNRTKWIGRFRGLYQNASILKRIKNVTFAHAGVYEGFWKGEPMNRAAENMAFFGETDEVRSAPDRRVPAFSWVERIPTAQYAVVGHDRRAPYPFVETNTLGGAAIFLDTGSGKGGQLSSVDLRFSEIGMRPEIFKMH